MLNEILEKGIVPDVILRAGIRNFLGQRLREEEKGSPEKNLEHKQAYIESLKQSPIAIHTGDANEQHYEVPTRFYQYVLGKRLKYSGGYWPEGVNHLDESEEKMLALSCQRAEIADGQKILDLGCGWGSLSLYIAEKYSDCQIVAVSNSKTQREYIEAQAQEKGYRNLRVVTEDMNDFTIEEQFDRVVSVEMLEHMKNYQKVFAKIASFLKEDGLFFTHIFTHIRYAYPFEVKDETDWMARYFFTGGMMPSDDLFLYFQDDLTLIKHWRVNGVHYAKTSEAWLANMDRHKQDIIPLFQQTYGEKEVTKWWSYWRVFFMSCAELWGYSNGNEWMVSHYLMSKK